MSNIRKCDVCGQENPIDIDWIANRRGENPFSTPSGWSRVLLRLPPCGEKSPKAFWDLCPECSLELAMALEAKAKKASMAPEDELERCRIQAESPVGVSQKENK